MPKSLAAQRIAPFLLSITIAFFSALSVQAIAQTLPGTMASQPATTATNVELPEKLTPEIIRELVSSMDDAAVRRLLLERLDAVAKKQKEAQEEASEGISEQVAEWATGVGNSIWAAVERIPNIPAALGQVATAISNDHNESGWVFLAKILAGVIGGIAAYLAVSRGPLGKRIRQPDPSATLLETISMLGYRLFVDLLALVGFVVVSIIIHRWLLSEENGPLLGLIMIYLVIIPLAVSALSRSILSPKWSDARLVYANDAEAKFFYRNAIIIAVLAGTLMFFSNFAQAVGIRPGESRIGFWLNLSIFVWLIIFLIRGRHALAKMLLGNEPHHSASELRSARMMPWLCVGFVGLTWLVVEILVSLRRFDLIQGGRQFTTLTAILLVPVFDTTIKGLVRHLVPPMTGEGELAERAYQATKRSYVRIGRVLMLAAVVYFLSALWGIDVSNVADAAPALKVLEDLFEVIYILAAGYVSWEVANLWFNRKLAAESTAAGIDASAEEPAGGEGGGQGGSRLSTVLPMIRLVLLTLIVVMTILLALSNLGVDVTPLLAGAGIVGIAIGFGAQTLVKDIVSGVFFLIDDAFRVGEYLVIGTTVGTVEKLSVRSLQLRHHNGPVHTIPYGEIAQVTNNSRDWVIMKMKFTVPFGSDIQKIKKLFKVIGAEMLETDYAGDLLQTFKSQGVYDVDDVGMVIRGKFMAKPGTQWVIRKDVYTRVQKILEANGIEFARREVRVQIPGMDGSSELTDEQKSAVGAAASQAAEAATKPAS
ncbi:MAG: mechanosensitive ion channel domain-containing protein [Rhizobiaceae bacterium]